MQHSAGKRKPCGSPESEKPEKNQPRNERSPQPHVPRGESGKIGRILVTQFRRGRRGGRGNKTFQAVAPAEHPFQPHVHLRIRRNVRKVRKTRIVRGNPLAVRDILRISEHHRAFNGVGNKIRTLRREGVTEIAVTQRLRVADSGRNPRGLHIVVTRLDEKRRRHTDTEEHKTEQDALHQKLLRRWED